MLHFEWLHQMGTQVVLRLLLMWNLVHQLEDISDCLQILKMVTLHLLIQRYRNQQMNVQVMR